MIGEINQVSKKNAILTHFPMADPIEIDVTFLNKNWFSPRLKQASKEKRYVIGFFQRDGNAIIKPLPNNSPKAIEKAVFENIEKGSVLYSEENILPTSLEQYYYMYFLKSSEGERVSGDVHVNNVKTLWKGLKRNLKRVHGHVSQKHLRGYCNEVTWRVNTRHLTPFERFEDLLNCIVKNGKTTYKDIVKQLHG